MTTITSNTPATSSTTGTAASTSADGLTSAADQEDRFMKLLVAQMQNQDPLNPMDNSQMTSQIAQINTVGGIQQLNTTVQSLLDAFTSMQGQNAVTLAGHDVLVDGSTMTLTDGKARGGVNLSSAATSVDVQVLDASGAAVRTIHMGTQTAGVHSFDWDGQLDDGSTAPDGTYSFSVAAASAGAAVPATALAAAHVNSVSPSAGGATLDLGTAGLVPLSAVRSYL